MSPSNTAPTSDPGYSTRSTANPSPVPDFLNVDALGTMIAAYDWSATPLGSIQDWPWSLKTTLATILRSPVPLTLLWGEAGTMLYNDGYATLIGGRHPDVLGMAVRDAWPEIADFNDQVMRAVLAGETLSYKDQELVLNRQGRLETAFFDLDYSPVVDEAGRAVGVLAVVIEITERVTAERDRDEAAAGLVRREAHWRGLFEELHEGFILGEIVRDGTGRSVDWTYLEVNPAFGRLVCQAPEATIGRTVREVFPGIEDAWIERMADVVETGRPTTFVDRVGTLDRWYEGHIFPLGDDRFGVMFVEVTERIATEQHQNMLMAELDHRVKNILATVQSIVQLSLNQDPQAGSQAAERVVARINALAQSHTLLADSRWRGAHFADLVETAVAPYRNQQAGRVVAEGSDLEVTPKAAQTLALVFQELSTNAAKYGALSTDGGELSAKWHLSNEDDARLVFVWQERGGPPIEGPPARKGFGSIFLEKMTSYDLGGEVTMDFARAGLSVVIELPVSNIQAKASRREKKLSDPAPV